MKVYAQSGSSLVGAIALSAVLSIMATYGYSVFPLTVGDRTIGLIAMNCEGTVLAVTGFWPEDVVYMGAGRMRALEAGLLCVAVFGGCVEVIFADGWLRDG